MRFVDYKCEDCQEVSEIIIRGVNGSDIKCKHCGSKNMVKIFNNIGFKGGSMNSNSTNPSSCSACSGKNG